MNCNALEGKRSSKCQALSVFDDDNPEEATVEKTLMLRNQLHFSHS
jgi:hypothetical protein